MEQWDFSGWATKANLKCSDGRTILKDAFKHNDGCTVPLVWNHNHDYPDRILGHALLENREQGVYAYCKFNDTETGKTAKILVQHGDIDALSIYANQLKQDSQANVIHGNIREVSLVLAGANPGAFIDSVIMHSEMSDGEEVKYSDTDAVIYTGDYIDLQHSDTSNKKEDDTVDNGKEKTAVETKETEAKTENKSEAKAETKETEQKEAKKSKTIGEVLETLNPEQAEVVYGLIGMLSEKEDKKENDKEDDEEDKKDMKHNVFEQEEVKQGGVLSHADQTAIIEMAKKPSVGSLKAAVEMYAEQQGTLAHAAFVDEEGNNAIDQLFPDYKLVKPGAPELVTRDLTWVDHVLNSIHKSPITRIRTRQADARVAELRAKGYNNREVAKSLSGDIKLITRTTDPQTVYRKDEMHRDDINDIQDFDVVAYQWDIMRQNLNEELALAAMIGDGRDDGDADKIHETHIRSIWNDEELYTIHADVDIAKAKSELQGSSTGANFGDNYVYAEAIITAALYAREQYKGSGNMDFYCTPHMLNVMMLARDLNGRRIYSSKTDLAAALNVKNIFTVEQFEGKTRTDKSGKEHKLLGLFVNLADYQFGCAKGGEITRFDDFDIDFNKYKYLMETRLSGALTKLYSAIALEEPVAAG